jgi:hypothetical protein
MLLFPVKLGPLRFWKVQPFAVAAALFVTGCGYRSAASPARSGDRLTVSGEPASTPHLEAVQAALAGARAGLSRMAALRSGSDYPRVVIAVVRVDEVATGIDVSTPGVPLARGSAVAVTGRAWVLERPGAEPARDTGDVRRVETVAQGPAVLPGAQAFESAVRSAARRVGEALALRILGVAEPSIEPM